MIESRVGRRLIAAVASAAFVLAAGVGAQQRDSRQQALKALLERAQAELRAAREGAALASFRAAEGEARSLDHLRFEVYAILGQSDVLRESGALERSLDEADRSLARIAAVSSEASEDSLDLRGRTLRQRAQVLSRMGRDTEADRDLSEAEELFGSLDDSSRQAGVRATRSVLAAQQGRYAEAVRHGRAALESLPEIQSSEGLGALSSVAYGEHRLGNLDVARTLYDELIQRAFDRGDQRLVLFATCNRAEILRSQGAEVRAEEELWDLIERVVDHRDALPALADERSVAFDLRANAFDQLIGLLFDTWRGAEGFAVAEKYRARSFLERAGPEAAHFAAVSPDGKAVQEVLDSDEALVAYWLLDDRTVVWTVTSERLDQVQIPVSKERIRSAVRDYLEELRAPALARTAGLLGTEEQHLDVGRELSRWLIGSLPAGVRAKTRWHVLLDGDLHHLPLDALPLDCEAGAARDSKEEKPLQHVVYRSCRFLGLEKAIGVVPSAAALLALRQRPPVRRSRSLVLAPDASGLRLPVPTDARRTGAAILEGARFEARRIHTMLTDSVLLEGHAASETALPHDAEIAYLHLATHGWADAEFPDRSGIALSPTDGEDGTLRVDEIVERRLRVRLVTLASCASAQGPLRRSEGLLGLARGFLLAGADAVLGSLWQVDDQATSVLFGEFYRILAHEENDPAEALRRARRKVFATNAERAGVFRRAQVAYAHPTYWSGFVLVGAP